MFELDEAEPSAEFDHVLIKVRGKLHERAESRGRTKRLAVLGGAIAACALAVVIWNPLQRGNGGNAPLTLKGGSELPAAHVFAAAQPTVLSDGSTVSVGPSAQLQLAENNPTRFRTELARGRVVFDVVPSEKQTREWLVVAGGVRVRVLGTRFSVHRAREELTVEVERGRVEVSGRNVEGGQQVLEPGDVLLTSLRGEDTAVHDAPQTPSPLPDESETTPEEVVPPSDDPPQASRDLIAQTDRLRSEGRYRDAARLLRQALSDPPAGLDRGHVAFTLGRIQLDHLGEPAAAGRTFGLALQTRLPPTLREQALARAVQAWATAGQHGRALQFGRRYLEAYPTGPNRDIVLRWLEHSGEP